MVSHCPGPWEKDRNECLVGRMPQGYMYVLQPHLVNSAIYNYINMQLVDGLRT